MYRVVLILALAGACGGGKDAPALPDADPNAPLCTGAVYDNCTANAGCDSMNCHLFEQDAIQVCTQACSASNPCPADASGTPGACNNRGICKPSRSNTCRPE